MRILHSDVLLKKLNYYLYDDIIYTWIVSSILSYFFNFYCIWVSWLKIILQNISFGWWQNFEGVRCLT